jgi:hypothetical protein
MHCLNLQPGNVHAAMNGSRHQVPFLRTIFGKERGPVVQNPALDIEPRFNHLSMNIFLDRSRDGALYLPNHAMLPLFGLHRSFSALARESIAASIPDTRHWCTHEVVHATGAPLRM